MLIQGVQNNAGPGAGDHGEPRIMLMLRLQDNAGPGAGDHREPGVLKLDARLYAGPYTAA